MRLAFLGLGRMGRNMAKRLLEAGHSLCLYNRSADKAAELAAAGASVAPTPAEALRGVAAAFTMLADDAALTAVMTDEAISALPPGAVHVCMGTISPRLARCMAKRHEELGRIYLACPVFGRPDAAAAGRLRLCLAGAQEAKDSLRPVLEVMGDIQDFGEDPAGGNAVKLAGNFMLASLVELLGEAYTLVEKHGVAPEAFFRFMSRTLLDAPAVRTYGQLILDADFDRPGFTVALGAKDMALVREAARSSHTPLPLAAVVEERLLRALARGWGEKDWSVLSLGQREDAGLGRP
jgi:3-hydroxyisobutyrate dehydrogenase-like beta-hydroxyacid dehydrogenase